MIDYRTAAYGAFVLRGALGLMWVSHALLKWFVFTLPGFAQFLTSKGLPSAAAWPVFLAELVGGVLILAGWHGRWVSLALLAVMAAALWTHIPNGWLHTSAGGGWEYPAFLLTASLAHTLLGDGAFALTGGASTAKRLDRAAD